MDKGKVLKEAYNTESSFFIIIFLLVLVIAGLLFYSDNLSQIESLIGYIVLVFLSYQLYSRFMLWETPALAVYENGIQSKTLKWSGSDFISWSEIKNIEIGSINSRVKINFLVIHPKNKEKYWAKWTQLGYVLFFKECNKLNSPIFINLAGLYVDKNELLEVCQEAMGNDNIYKENLSRTHTSS